MHGVFAVSKFINSRGKRACINDTLVIRVEIASALATVAEGVNGPLSGSSSEPSGVLIVIISQWPSGGEGFAAVFSARVVGLKFVVVFFYPWKSDG